MSLYAVNLVLYDAGRNPQIIRDFQQSPDEVLDRYDLTEEERRVLKEGTASDLYAMGVHPNLIIKFAGLRSIRPTELYQHPAENATGSVEP